MQNHRPFARDEHEARSARVIAGRRRQALGGGVTRSLILDTHGKSLSSALLDLEVPDDPHAHEAPA